MVTTYFECRHCNKPIKQHHATMYGIDQNVKIPERCPYCLNKMIGEVVVRIKELERNYGRFNKLR